MPFCYLGCVPPVEGSGPKTQLVGREIHLDRPKLVVLTGARKGEEFLLKNPGARIAVGSGARCEIVLPGLGERHAELELAVDGVRVFDRSNGRTRLNGTPIHEA